MESKTKDKIFYGIFDLVFLVFSVFVSYRVLTDTHSVVTSIAIFVLLVDRFSQITRERMDKRKIGK